MNGLRKWFASGRRLGPTVRRLATLLVVVALLVPAGVAVPQSEAAIPVEGPVGASGAYGGDASRCEAGDPDFPECWTGANCTAKDAGTLQLRLADWVTGQPLEPCSPGETANAVVMATIDSNTNRYQALAYFSLYINGVFEGDYVVCFADMIAQTPPHSPPSDYRVFPLDVPLQWECGDKVEFRAFYLGWNQSSATCSATACCPGTKSKCERFGDVTVLTPLVASFTYQTGCNRAVSFDDTVTGGVEPYTRLWNFGDGVGTSSAADPTYTYGAAGTYTVTLTVTDNEGTEATWEEEITVPAGVGVSIAADPGLVLTCDHPTIELEATGSGGTAPYSYAWDLDGLPGYETPGAVQYVTQAGIYTVQVTDANLCTATDSVEVTDERDLAVEIDATPGLVLTCDDPSIQLEAKASGGDGSYTYAWDLDGDGQYDDATSAVVTGINAEGSYAVRVSDGGGCVVYDSVQVDDQRDLTAEIEATPGLVLTCDVASIQLEAKASGGDGSYAYAWDLDDDGDYDDAYTAVVTGIDAEGTYAVRVTDGGGCVVYDSVWVQDQSDLDVDIEPTPGLVLTCLVTSIQLEAKASGGDGSYAYAWDLDADGQYDDAYTALVTGIDAEGTYAVQVTDGNECQATDSVFVDDLRDPFSVSIDADRTSLTCEPGDSITLTAIVQLEVPQGRLAAQFSLWSYQWYRDGDPTGTDSNQLVVTAGGLYSVTVTNTETGCSESSEPIEIYEPPCEADLAISKTADRTTAVLGDVINYTIIVTNTGDVALEGVQVWDDLLGIDEVISLDSGESQTFTGSHTVTPADVDAGVVLNTAYAEHEDAGQVQDGWEVEVLSLGLNVTKTAVPTSAKVGDVIEYTIVVQNAGEATLEEVWVLDSMLGIDTDVGPLGPGASATLTATYTVKQGDLPGPLVNTVVVTSGDLSDEDSATVTLGEEPPPTCVRSDLSVLIYGGWSGIAVNASVSGTGQDTQYTALDGNGTPAVLWTFWPGEGETLNVVVTPQLPGDLDPDEWKFEPGSASVSIKRCQSRQLTFTLVHTPQPPEEFLLPVTGARHGLLGTVADWWQSLVGWCRRLFAR